MRVLKSGATEVVDLSEYITRQEAAQLYIPQIERTAIENRANHNGSAPLAAIAGLPERLDRVDADIALIRGGATPPPNQPTVSVAASVDDATADVGQTITVTLPTWSSTVNNQQVHLYRAATGALLQSLAVGALTFQPQAAWVGQVNLVVTGTAANGSGNVSSPAISFTVNAATATPTLMREYCSIRPSR